MGTKLTFEGGTAKGKALLYVVYGEAFIGESLWRKQRASWGGGGGALLGPGPGMMGGGGGIELVY